MNGIKLYLESASDYRITKIERGGKMTTIGTDEARRLYESGKVEDYNLALERLAREGWNLDAVKAYYAGKR